MLQSALLLLSLAQSSHGLSPTLQSSAISVANQAIMEATAALSGNSTASTSVQTSNQSFTTPSGAVVSAGGTVLNTPTVQPSDSVSVQTATPSQGTIVFTQLAGSQQVRNGTANLYFTVQNKTQYEAHVDSLTVQLTCYGCVENTGGWVVAVQDDAGETYANVPFQWSNQSATSTTITPVSLNLNQPLVVYENGQKNFRIAVAANQWADAQIESASIQSVGFSGAQSNFTSAGLPLTLSPQQVISGESPADF